MCIEFPLQESSTASILKAKSFLQQEHDFFYLFCKTIVIILIWKSQYWVSSLKTRFSLLNDVPIMFLWKQLLQFSKSVTTVCHRTHKNHIFYNNEDTHWKTTSKASEYFISNISKWIIFLINQRGEVLDFNILQPLGKKVSINSTQISSHINLRQTEFISHTLIQF